MHEKNEFPLLAVIVVLIEPCDRSLLDDDVEDSVANRIAKGCLPGVVPTNIASPSEMKFASAVLTPSKETVMTSQAIWVRFVPRFASFLPMASLAFS